MKDIIIVLLLAVVSSKALALEPIETRSEDKSEFNVAPDLTENKESRNVSVLSERTNCHDGEPLTPHESRCDQFYECVHGQLETHTCPSQLAFNFKEQRCDWPSNVDCGGDGDADAIKYLFRKDYTYLTSTRSFYKIHPSAKTWHGANEWCALEGASLFHPSNQHEYDIVSSLWSSKHNFDKIYVGGNDLLVSRWFETIDGTPVEDLYNKWNDGEPNNHYERCLQLQRPGGGLNDVECHKIYPFICVKRLDNVVWDESCDMPDLGYKYDDVLGKCYKVHTGPVSWNEAYIRCRKELSYLAFTNTQEEVDVLKKITVKGSEVFLGFHNVDETGWKTVDGKLMSENNVWGPNRPDNPNNNKCVSMYDSGLLNNRHCEHDRLPFICEHDVRK